MGEGRKATEVRRAAQRLQAKAALTLSGFAVAFAALTLFVYATSDTLTGSPWSQLRAAVGLLFLAYLFSTFSGVVMGLYVWWGAQKARHRRRGRLASALGLLALLALPVGRAIFG